MGKIHRQAERNTVGVRRSSLDLDDAVEVWLLRWKGNKQHVIAAMFGCNQGRISEILTGKAHPGSKALALLRHQC